MTRVAPLSLLFGLIWSGTAAAQAPAPTQHIVGNQISGSMRFDPQAGVSVDTTTLTFRSGPGGQIYAVDLVARHPVGEPVAPPAVVDLIVTQQFPDDEAPAMAVRVDGEPLAVVPRLRSQRSVVASLPLSDVDRLANAGAVIDSVFGVELEFSPAQVRMLRATVDRWVGRARQPR